VSKPDFFLLGAPKCGTTSFAAWLATHPRIYMPIVKEPDFFNTDEAYRWRPSMSFDEYEKLFSGAAEDHLAIGEASVWYLHSTVAVPNILMYVPSSRFIVMLRNPIEMARSLYEFHVSNGNEHIAEFSDAWGLQDARRAGREISPWCWEPPSHLVYGDACRLGEQLERLYTQVPRDRVLTILLDDLKNDTRGEYLRALKFLGVPDDGKTSFPTKNQAKRTRSMFLRRLIRSVGAAKRVLGIPHRGLGLLAAVNRANSVEGQSNPLTREMWTALADYFADDIRKLSTLLNRDLSHWLTYRTSGARRDRATEVNVR
jgi:hypothetical protein